MPTTTAHPTILKVPSPLTGTASEIIFSIKEMGNKIIIITIEWLLSDLKNLLLSIL